MLSGLGPPPLAPGDRLPIGTATIGEPLVDVAPVADLPLDIVLRVLPGPRVNWFAPETLDRLTRATYTVAPDSDRVATRLTGPPLSRVRKDELPSEGLVLGAVQVTHNGSPVVFLADHPTTGGYPVVAVVRRADLPVLAQARPGELVRFRLGTQ